MFSGDFSHALFKCLLFLYVPDVYDQAYDHSEEEEGCGKNVNRNLWNWNGGEGTDSELNIGIEGIGIPQFLSYLPMPVG